AAPLATPSVHGEIASQAPSTTLIHSSQSRKIESSTISAMITSAPTASALFIARVSLSKNSVQGESRSHSPSTQLVQSSHCLGNENADCAMLVLRERVAIDRQNGRAAQSPNQGLGKTGARASEVAAAPSRRTHAFDPNMLPHQERRGSPECESADVRTRRAA